MSTPKITLVGCGAVNLITAYYLVRKGWQVEVIDMGPNPNQGQPHPGATWGGQDARMFTLTEADNYNAKTPFLSPQKLIFNQQLQELGWDARHDRTGEIEWVNAHSNLHFEEAVRCKDAVLKFNIESGPLWNAMIRQSPDLFEGTVLKQGIIRIYSDENQYLSQLERHRSLDSLIENFTPLEKILCEMPGLALPAKKGAIAGAFKTQGFTVNAHKFFTNLVQYLDQNGVDFHWQEKVLSIERNSDGKVTALLTEKRNLSNGYFVVSPGAYGNELLQNSSSRNLIGGVLGGWATLPHLDTGFRYSMKIARKGHVTEDSNVTLATQNNRKILHVGSGYGFTGFDPNNISPEQLELVYQGIQNTIKTYFPREYAMVKGTREFHDSFSYCVRPWTSNGLGIFEQVPTASGGVLVVNGGHNTGGFAQAPAVGKAVVAVVEGRRHAMHGLYHPERHLFAATV